MGLILRMNHTSRTEQVAETVDVDGELLKVHGAVMYLVYDNTFTELYTVFNKHLTPSIVCVCQTQSSKVTGARNFRFTRGRLMKNAPYQLYCD